MADYPPTTPRRVSEPDSGHSNSVELDAWRQFRLALAALTRVVAPETFAARRGRMSVSPLSFDAQERAYESLEARLRRLRTAGPAYAREEPSLYTVIVALHTLVTSEAAREMRAAFHALEDEVAAALSTAEADDGHGPSAHPDLRRARLLAVRWLAVFARPVPVPGTVPEGDLVLDAEDQPAL